MHGNPNPQKENTNEQETDNPETNLTSKPDTKRNPAEEKRKKKRREPEELGQPKRRHS